MHTCVYIDVCIHMYRDREATEKLRRKPTDVFFYTIYTICVYDTRQVCLYACVYVSVCTCACIHLSMCGGGFKSYIFSRVG